MHTLGYLKNKNFKHEFAKIKNCTNYAKSLNLEVHAISSSAKSKIEKAGGEVKVIN